MKKGTVLFVVGVVLFALMGLQGCDDPKPTIESDDFCFKATNLTVDDCKLSANGGKPALNVDWTVQIAINGVMTTVRGTCMSDELPVRAGDEIEILFEPRCPEQTEAFFTLPDGTTRTTTASSPSFRWKVPADFSPGLEIKGESRYETEDVIYEMTGSISLIDLE